ncbi:hypothetical protein [Pseudonocardia acaciae]|nr:hypothetical protein [Pseudonocardia acaciae]
MPQPRGSDGRRAAKNLGSSPGRLSHLDTGRKQQPPEDVEKLMRF